MAKTTSLASTQPGNPAAPSPAGGVAGHGAGLPGAPVVAAGQSVPLFGGHRGGGKKRKDGLAAGSAEALAADREKDKLRKQAARCAGRSTPVPAPLPSASALAAPSAADPGAPVAGGASAVPVPAAPAGVAVVLWNPRLLEKPARLLTRLGDYWRTAVLVKKLDHPKLPSEMRAEIKRDIALPHEVTDGFANALAEFSAVELNKRGVGAGQSHVVNLAGHVVEMAAHSLAVSARLDRMIAKLEEEKPEAKAEKKEDRG